MTRRRQRARAEVSREEADALARSWYRDPASPDREQWAEPRADDPILDPILGDCTDEPWTGSAER